MNEIYAFGTLSYALPYIYKCFTTDTFFFNKTRHS